MMDRMMQYSGVSAGKAKESNIKAIYINSTQQKGWFLCSGIHSDTVHIGHTLHNNFNQLCLIPRRIANTVLIVLCIGNHEWESWHQFLTDETKEDRTGAGSTVHNCLQDTFVPWTSDLVSSSSGQMNLRRLQKTPKSIPRHLCCHCLKTGNWHCSSRALFAAVDLRSEENNSRS